MKKIIQRTCVGCKCKKDKRELIRIIIDTASNRLIIDKTGKMQGRGMYICGEDKCLTNLKKTKKLEKMLSIVVYESFYKEIEGIIEEKRNKNKESEVGESIGEN